MKTTKVYHAPGYPLDPAKEKQRMINRMSDFAIVRPDLTFYNDYTKILHQIENTFFHLSS